MTDIHISVIPFGSELYEQTKAVRTEILRTPWGLKLSEKDVHGEESQIHIAAIDDSRHVIAAVILKPLSSDTVKLRQMAVLNEVQGTGVGKRMVAFAEETARQKGFRHMELHGRVTAQAFYEKLGYVAQGEPFIEATVPNILMKKRL